jgi:hypothetical protein
MKQDVLLKFILTALFNTQQLQNRTDSMDDMRHTGEEGERHGKEKSAS